MAHWIKEFPRAKCQTFLCSECGTRVYYIDNLSRGKNPKKSVCRYTFCPWCKAEMEGLNTQFVIREEIIL